MLPELSSKPAASPQSFLVYADRYWQIRPLPMHSFLCRTIRHINRLFEDIVYGIVNLISLWKRIRKERYASISSCTLLLDNLYHIIVDFHKLCVLFLWNNPFISILPSRSLYIYSPVTIMSPNQSIRRRVQFDAVELASRIIRSSDLRFVYI